LNFVIFVIAMAVLIWGADLIIRQSERIAVKFKISEFVIAATLIALGTSLPEMAVSIAGSYTDKPTIAISNVIGSNILNITLILATILLIAKKVHLQRDFFAKDSIWVFLVTMVFILMMIDGIISRFDALLLLLLMGAYLLFLLEDKKYIKQKITVIHADNKDFSWLKTLPVLFIGFIFVMIGGHFTVESASAIAKHFAISEWIIGMLMISLGTALPELVISISATLKGKVEMAIGNIIGSNIVNTTVVIAAASLTSPLYLHASEYLFDIATMIVATLVLVFITANKLYTKSLGISLMIILALFLHHTLESL
jgi:cation:H+ antiporter